MKLLVFIALFCIAPGTSEPPVENAHPEQPIHDVATVKMLVEEPDFSTSIKTSVRFVAGQKATGPVGCVMVADRGLQMTFDPVNGPKSAYRVEARWRDTGGQEIKTLFLVQAVVSYGQTQKFTRAGPEGKLVLEVTVDRGK